MEIIPAQKAPRPVLLMPPNVTLNLRLFLKPARQRGVKEDTARIHGPETATMLQFHSVPTVYFWFIAQLHCIYGSSTGSLRAYGVYDPSGPRRNGTFGVGGEIPCIMGPA